MYIYIRIICVGLQKPIIKCSKDPQSITSQQEDTKT